MNRDEAKYILRSYHLGAKDVEDPQFHEALELSKRDPALGAWFSNEQALDIRLSRKLLSFPVPPNLKTQLIASRRTVPIRYWWQQPAWVSAAACLAGLLLVVGWLLHSSTRPRVANFRSYVADTTAQLQHLDLVTTNLLEVRHWLEDQNAPRSFAIPAGLNGRPSVGCRAFNWKGHAVSLVCFKIDDLGTVHLFVMKRSTRNEFPAGTNPEFTSHDNGITTASWGNDQYIYVLAGKLDEKTIRQLL